MSAKYNGYEILQVTKAQCPGCGARSVFSVLVAELNGGAGRNSDRAFYTCERALLKWHYLPHDCQRESQHKAA